MKGTKDLVDLYLEGYHIVVDRYNWSLYSIHNSKDRKGNFNGETHEVSEGHFHTLGQLLKQHAQLESILRGPSASVDKLLAFYGGMMRKTRDRLLSETKSIREAMEVNKAPLVNDAILD